MADETTNSTPTTKPQNSGNNKSRRQQTPVVTNTTSTDTGTGQTAQTMGGGIPIKPPANSSQSTESDAVTSAEPAAAQTLGGGIPIKPPAAQAVQVVVADEAPSSEPSSLTISDDDDPQVKDLKIQLKAFVEAVSQPGQIPTDFRAAARLLSQITQFVIRFPKVPVLDALLAFFEEHNTTAAAPQNMLKGVTTLSNNDQQQIGVLFSLFSDLASRNVVACNSGKVVQVLKKPEIPNYYNRRVAGIQASTK